jgi:hypothetical protein
MDIILWSSVACQTAVEDLWSSQKITVDHREDVLGCLKVFVVQVRLSLKSSYGNTSWVCSSLFAPPHTGEEHREMGRAVLLGNRVGRNAHILNPRHLRELRKSRRNDKEQLVPIFFCRRNNEGE